MTDPLFTDFYEITMAAAYFAAGIADDRATFELFVRDLPGPRRFLVASGIDDALDYVRSVRFDDEAIAYLRSLDRFDVAFLDYLRDVRFDGEAWAVAEGEVVFAGEPLVELTCSRAIGQLVETAVINHVMFPTIIASKAARVTIACEGRAFLDFSARRDHGTDAARRAARAAVIGGAAGTSLVRAGADYGLALSGTMAHSYVLSFPEERDAFRSYARLFPSAAIFLIDTYDTIDGAKRAAEVALELAPEGISVAGVRLDSGDLGTLAVEVRRILDDAGLGEVRIFASGDLDEYRISSLVAAGAPIDAFGVGTQLGTSADAPYLGGVYKLVDDPSGPKKKLSPGKATVPGRKQVWRCADHDVVALREETVAGGRPMLEPALDLGGADRPRATIDEATQRRAAAVAGLPPTLRRLSGPYEPWPVRMSPLLAQLTAS